MSDEIIYVENGELIRRHFDPWSPARQHMRDVSIPRGASDADLAAHGAIRVQPTPMPAADVVTELDPVLVDGRWVQAWDARGYTNEERAERLALAKQYKLQELTAEQDRRVDAITGTDREKQTAMMKALLLMSKRDAGTLTDAEAGLLAALEGIGAMVSYLEDREAALVDTINTCDAVEQVEAINVKDAAHW